MKRVLFILVILAAAFAAFGADKRPFETFQYPKLADVKLPPVTEYMLANGLKIMLVEDHTLPLVKGRLMLRAGSVFDPAEKAGLSGITFEVLRSGGTVQKTGDAVDEFLESRSAFIDSAGGEESGSVSFNCLAQNFAEVFPLYADFILNPGCREDKMALSRDQAKSGISRRNDEAQSVAFSSARTTRMPASPSMPPWTPSPATTAWPSTRSTSIPKTPSWPSGATLPSPR